MWALAPEFAVFEGEGTLFGAIGKDDFRTIQILSPGKPLEDLFQRSIGKLDDLIEANERQSRTLAMLRGDLLPRLLGGELRVRQAENVVERVLA
jgi:type I restriction enzyme S subunit